MDLNRKIIILVIILLSIYIIYNLLKSRQAIKINYIKEQNALKEGFDATGVSIASIPEKYYSLPIREFIVKSSYNSAINDKNLATKEQIKAVLERGCRLIDFEIYTRNNIEYVSYSEDPEYQSMDSGNEESTRLSLGDAFNTVVGYAFTSPSPSPNDPLFLLLRIKNNSSESYSRIAKLMDYAFKNHLYKGKFNGETELQKLMNKIVIVLDKTSSPNYKNNVKCSSNPCFQLSDYIHIETGSVQFPKYTYGNLETLPQKPVMTSGKLRTDIQTFMMITPAQIDNFKMLGSADIISKWHPQFLLCKFYNSGKELQEYEDVFNENQSSFVPIAAIVTKERAKNSAATNE